jgi:hypothetical protein
MSASEFGHQNTLARVLAFIAELDHRRIHYGLTSDRAEALMVQIAIPGERWEVEFMADGSVEIERFLSGGDIGGEEALGELWKLVEE